MWREHAEPDRGRCVAGQKEGCVENHHAEEDGSGMCWRCSRQQEACLALLQAAHFKALPARREVLYAVGYKVKQQTVNEPGCKLPYAYV